MFGTYRISHCPGNPGTRGPGFRSSTGKWNSRCISRGQLLKGLKLLDFDVFHLHIFILLIVILSFKPDKELHNFNQRRNTIFAAKCSPLTLLLNALYLNNSSTANILLLNAHLLLCCNLNELHFNNNENIWVLQTLIICSNVQCMTFSKGSNKKKNHQIILHQWNSGKYKSEVNNGNVKSRIFRISD